MHIYIFYVKLKKLKKAKNKKKFILVLTSQNANLITKLFVEKRLQITLKFIFHRIA